MLDGDCRRKFDFSSEPVRVHLALLWSNPLYMYDWKKMTAENALIGMSARGQKVVCFDHTVETASGFEPASL